ncbi:alpha-mannosidase, partial [Clostridium sp.]|uniref:alpha-mannosidase n=1 Tax=Clostridium sp. TaxID=1506 RepID=UPI003F36F02C
MKFLSKKLTVVVMLATMSISMSNPIVAYAYDKSKTAHMLGNGHIDVAWEWRIEETIRECEATFGRAIKNLEKFDDYRYSQSQAQLYAYTEEYYPELFEKIKNQVADGKWDITGGQMVESDLNLPSGESLVRQSLYGQKYFKEKFDKTATVGWVPDTFGFTYNFPQILKGSGMDYFITTKLNWNETNKWPHEVFNWKSPDGSEVLAYKPTSDYVWNGSALGNPSSYDAIMDQQAKKGLSTSIALYGAGDHGGGPNENDINYIKQVDNNEAAMNIEMSMAEDAFKALEADIQNTGTSEIATIDNELYFEKHRGTYTTGGAIKKYNRMSEIQAEVAEKFATLSYLLDAVDYPIEKIEQAWKIITLNQFHDILPGSSINSVYLDAYNDSEIALNLLNAVKEDALAALAARVNTNTVEGGIPIVLFNSLSWDRDEFVEQEIVFDKEVSNVEILDSNGNPVESELVSVDGKIAKVLFKAKVPSLGYSTYTAIERENEYIVNDGVKADEENYTLENKYFKVKLNPETGNINSIIDKKNGNKEVLEDGKEANEFNILEDTPVYWEAWDVDMDDMNREAEVVNGLKDIELINSSETKSTFRVTREWGSSEYFSDITLYSDEDRIDIKTGVNWNEEQKILKVAFPLSVNPEKATYEVAYGTVERDTSWENRTTGAQFEVSGHKWADMTEGDYGVSILNDSKYGWDTLDNRIRLTLLRSTMSRAGESDRERYHEINYSIYPHSGTFAEANTVREAYNFNYKMDSIQTKSHNGELEKSKSFATTNKKNIILSALKKAEEGQEVIVRLYEADGLENT